MNLSDKKNKKFSISLGKRVGLATGSTFFRAKNFTRKSGILFTILLAFFLCMSLAIITLGFKFILILVDIS